MRCAFFVCVLICICPVALAQWHAATGPSGGEIASLAIDPLDADSIYAADRLLWHSADGAKTWSRAEGVPLPQGERIRAIAISPDKDGPIFIYAKHTFVSRDRGATWTLLDVPWRTMAWNSLQFGPAGSGVVYCVSEQKIYRSADSGTTWKPVTGVPKAAPSIEYLQVDRFDADTISFMYRHEREAVLVMSRDGGASFDELPLPEDNAFVVSISTDPDEADLLYVCIQSPAWGRVGQRRFYYSYDAGATWELLWDPLVDGETDEATTAKLRAVLPSAIVSAMPPFDGRWIPFRPELAWSENEPGRVVGTAMGTLYRSDDYGATWAPGMTRLAGTSIERIVFDPKDAKAAYCSDARHVWRTADRGATWTLMPLRDWWFVRHLTYSPDGQYVFVVSDGIWRGKRDGTDWEQVWQMPSGQKLPFGIFFYDAAVGEDEPVPTATLVGAGFVLESTDGGATWEEVDENNFEMHPTQYIKRFQQRQLGGRDVWLAHDTHEALRVSTDHGRTWQIDEATNRFRAQSWSLADDGAAWLVDWWKLRFIPPPDERPHKSRMWEDAKYTAVVCEPGDARVAYVARQDGRVLRTTDRGGTFDLLEGGPSGVEIVQLALSPHDGALWVATTGNGVWILDNPKTQPAVTKTE